LLIAREATPIKELRRWPHLNEVFSSHIQISKQLKPLSSILTQDDCILSIDNIDRDVFVVALLIDHFDRGLMRSMVNCLNRSELARFESYKSPQSAMYFLTGRYIVKRFISINYDESINDVDILIGANGKPRNRHASFNVSHSYGMVVAAFGRHIDIGIDIEAATAERIDLLSVADAALPHADFVSLSHCDEAEVLELFNKKWSFHEARIKMDALTLADMKHYKSRPFKKWGLFFDSREVYGHLCCRREDLSYRDISCILL